MFSPREVQFAVLAFSSLFSVINPISAAPIFVALTRGSRDRRRAAFRACLTAAGGAIFSFFGITVPAFQIAGGILFTLMSIREVDYREKHLPEDDSGSADPSIVPLGIPLIGGPARSPR
jgi:multiple antibiotic resistance protein